MFHFVADGVEEVGFAESGAAVNEKWVVSIAWRLTYGDTACVGESVAGSDDEVFEGIIGMEGRLVGISLACRVESGVAVCRKSDGNEMASNLLGGPGKSDSAVIL